MSLDIFEIQSMLDNNKNMKKKNRSTNWTEEEKILLKKLIAEKIHIIEEKDCTTNTNNIKKKAWEEVHSNFNTLNSQQRSLQQLQNQWRNTKTLMKLQNSSDQNHMPSFDLVLVEGENKFIPQAEPSVEGEEDSSVMAQTSVSPKPTTKPLNKVLNKSKRKLIDYEKEIFLKTMEAKQQAIEIARNEHEERMQIFKMEKEYWGLKLAQLKQQKE